MRVLSMKFVDIQAKKYIQKFYLLAQTYRKLKNEIFEAIER